MDNSASHEKLGGWWGEGAPLVGNGCTRIDLATFSSLGLGARVEQPRFGEGPWGSPKGGGWGWGSPELHGWGLGVGQPGVGADSVGAAGNWGSYEAGV